VDTRFDLYEDEGVNYNYEKGKFSNIPIAYNEQSKTLTIGERTGDFPGMIANRKFKIVWVNINKPVGMDSKHSDQVIDYNGSAVTVKMK
jgi:alpha-D-xyloside xylohydrolase